LELHRRAAAWWEENGFIDQAIDHALRCGEPDWAASLLEAHVEELWHNGEGMFILRWMTDLPDEVVRKKPMLCIIRGFYLYGAGEVAEADRFFAFVESEIAPSAGDRGPALCAKLAATRALICSFSGEEKKTMSYAALAEKSLPVEELTWRGHIAFSIAEIAAFGCDAKAGEEQIRKAVGAYKEAGSTYWALLSGHREVDALVEQGRLAEAKKLCFENIQRAEECGLAQRAGIVEWYLSLGEILNQQGDDEAVPEYISRGMSLDRRIKFHPVRRCWSYFVYMRVLLTWADYAGIQETIQEIRDLAKDSEAPGWVEEQARMWQARLDLAQGRLDSAAQWMTDKKFRTDSIPEEPTLFQFQEFVVAARILVAQGYFEEAIDLLSQLRAIAQKNGLITREIEIKGGSRLAPPAL
jgi:LuxR family maltose regulon positive regulatory protein